jgi:hypothetical protein
MPGGEADCIVLIGHNACCCVLLCAVVWWRQPLMLLSSHHYSLLRLCTTIPTARSRELGPCFPPRSMWLIAF